MGTKQKEEVREVKTGKTKMKGGKTAKEISLQLPFLVGFCGACVVCVLERQRQEIILYLHMHVCGYLHVMKLDIGGY